MSLGLKRLTRLELLADIAPFRLALHDIANPYTEIDFKGLEFRLSF
jgi:hypothetical protein